jgi:thiamine-monophosphate kinase
MDTPPALTPVSELGEFGLIERLAALLPPPHPSVLQGIGDDAAVIELGNGRVQLVSTDLLLEGVHFDLAYAPLKHLGYKAIAVNVSDICAMNGSPTHCVVGLGLSSRFPVEAAEELYRGMAIACDEYGLDLVGGDTTSSQTGLVISVTVYGLAQHHELTLRSGGQPNDLLCVSGHLGAALAGLRILEREKHVFLSNPGIQPDLAEHEYVVGQQLRPQARNDLKEVFQQLGVQPTAMIDISDGLASEVAHIAKASRCGAVIYPHRLPIDPRTRAVAQLFDRPATEFALYGGEDYELLFTVRPSEYERLTQYPGIATIGHLTEASTGLLLANPDGTTGELKPMGFRHFSIENPNVEL